MTNRRKGLRIKKAQKQNLLEKRIYKILKQELLKEANYDIGDYKIDLDKGGFDVRSHESDILPRDHFGAAAEKLIKAYKGTEFERDLKDIFLDGRISLAYDATEGEGYGVSLIGGVMDKLDRAEDLLDKQEVRKAGGSAHQQYTKKGGPFEKLKKRVLQVAMFVLENEARKL